MGGGGGGPRRRADLALAQSASASPTAADTRPWGYTASERVVLQGARVIGAELAKDIAEAFLSASFDPEGRSAGNVKAIDEVGAKYQKGA